MISNPYISIFKSVVFSFSKIYLQALLWWEKSKLKAFKKRSLKLSWVSLLTQEVSAERFLRRQSTLLTFAYAWSDYQIDYERFGLYVKGNE